MPLLSEVEAQYPDRQLEILLRPAAVSGNHSGSILPQQYDHDGHSFGTAKNDCPALLYRLMLLIYRYIFVLLDASLFLSPTSQNARWSWGHLSKSFGGMVQALFIRAMKRSRNTSMTPWKPDATTAKSECWRRIMKSADEIS